MKNVFGLSQKSAYVIELTRGWLSRQYFNRLYSSHVKIGKKFRRGRYCNMALWGKCQFILGDGVYLRNFCRIQVEDGALKIGNNTFFNNFCTLNCLYKITIGDDCLFGENVKLYDHNHKYKDNRLIREQGYSLGEIYIGDNCWIGSNVVILKDVRIGDNVVIGANCVIHKDIASNTLVKHSSDLLEDIYSDQK